MFLGELGRPLLLGGISTEGEVRSCVPLYNCEILNNSHFLKVLIFLDFFKENHKVTILN